MKQLLITGASGFLGSYLCQEAKNHFEIITTSRNDASNPLDLADEKALKIFLSTLKVDGIIHLAANGFINYCEENPEETHQLNVRATEILSKYACKLQIPFVFTSTDQVFDGKQSFYKETDQPKPLNEYGKQKLEAEKLVLKNKGIVCRMPLMIGANGGYQKTLIQKLQAGEPQTLFIDEWRSVLSVELAAKALLQALNWKSDVYHLGGPKRINRYELALKISKGIKNFDTTLLKKGKQSDIQFFAQRPADVSLNSDKALGLGFVNVE